MKAVTFIMNSSSPSQSPSAHNYTPFDVKKLLLATQLRDGAGVSKGIPSTILSNFSTYDPNATMPFATAISLGENECLQSVIEKAATNFALRDRIRQDVRYFLKNSDAEDMRISVDRLLDEDIKERGLFGKDPNIFKRPTLSKV
ncbi:hypothetical protein NHQ30_010387 [Ciborinia camelliae]|nr:hypothetical protein NHQ30_010387 [Ciborinia camelliae]